MHLELGHPVDCSDRPAGDLADVVIDPTRRRVTHLVVAPRHRHGGARLVPVDLTTVEEGAESRIALRCTFDELGHLPPVEEFAYVRAGEFPIDDPDWDVGIETVLVQPYYDYLDVGSPAMDLDPHLAVVYDRIPKGEIEIRRASGVVSADGRRLGHVEGLLVDRDEQITHVVLERGHVFGRREVTIPVGAVARVTTDSVELALTKRDVDRLPAVPVHRWGERLAPG